MQKILLDTNAYSAFMSGNETVLKWIVGAESVLVSVIVMGELYAGFHGGRRYAENLAALDKFLHKDRVSVLNVTAATGSLFGEIKARLRNQGMMIPINDVWLAAQAVESGARLITRDGHFERIATIKIGTF